MTRRQHATLWLQLGPPRAIRDALPTITMAVAPWIPPGVYLVWPQPRHYWTFIIAALAIMGAIILSAERSRRRWPR